MAENKDLEKMDDAKEEVEASVKSVKETTTEVVKEVSGESESNKKMIVMLGGLVAVFLVALLLVAFVLVLAGNRGNTTSDAKDIPSDWEKFENDEFVIGYPSDWETEESERGISISSPEEELPEIDYSDPEFEFDSASIFGNRVSVAVDIINKNDEDFTGQDDDGESDKAFKFIENNECDDFQDFLEEESEGISESDVKYTKGNLNGLDTCVAEIKQEANENDPYSIYTEGEFHIFTIGDDLYTVMFTSYSANAEDNMETAREILSTFKLKN